MANKKKNKRISKKKAAYFHAEKRARERYNIVFNRRFERQLLEQMRILHNTCAEKQSNRISIHVVPFDNREFTIVYDKLRKVIVSFLPVGSYGTYSNLPKEYNDCDDYDIVDMDNESKKETNIESLDNESLYFIQKIAC